ncbi:transcription factor IIa, putative [Trypanosoma equiperdum]|uniref:Transcription factor IIa n=5 Tax=Trypanozoon TaxID=39700 RepID=Q38BB7_TRYB2|nr:hypothetical protein, conserved [Trypanosoma brucei gambiense DAL972]XP_822731.1 hypothetical protein, conserved [Trypanosoma brucei brucei TREU927]RHW69074.1 transcription factor IIa [Trypanosoma brucei equiperdum]CAI59560.1 transcription factor IIA gamma subunit [Trypanosoma brucei brucei]SCU71382.1 transcription factor IIa, putative [Trypanosoma equiperdum]EAN77903.1 hypothetical protein, conserved [Trypanosoma brucei brucei TREU927]CBH15504.1 hypothetical protein, conserved [Trypanosom|eukprot:XP_011777768.1 hypothetical protein, conserved [Trypanosoma brucei gambiense DAL972]
MYRESLLGVALGATLAELESDCLLTEGQKQQLWEIFDIAMDRTLAEAPVRSQVRVRTSAPSLVGHATLGGESGLSSIDAPTLSTRPAEMEFPLPPSEVTHTVATTPCDVLDEEVLYPVYRVKDGMWTILLKDPILELTDATGSTETIRLDYLKVYLKEVVSRSATSVSASSRKKRKRSRP